MDMNIMKDKGLSSSGRNMFITFDISETNSNQGFEINIHKGILYLYKYICPQVRICYVASISWEYISKVFQQMTLKTDF